MPCTRGTGREPRATANRPALPCGSGSDSALTSALARPRVVCSSSRVAMNDGHITPVDPFRHTPMFMQRSAAPRIPPVASNDRSVVSGWAAGSTGSRRLSVIEGASTILPGFKRLCGSKMCFTARIASYRSSPNTRRLNSLRASPSPCSLELTPPYCVTRSRISSATARIVATSAGSVRSMNGRMCRHPTDAWP